MKVHIRQLANDADLPNILIQFGGFIEALQ